MNTNNKEKLTISEVDLENEAQLELHLKKIKRQEWKEYFSLSIFKITLLGMLSAFNMTLAVVSFYALGLVTIFPGAPFLKLEITFISYLIMYLCTNGFYALAMVTPLTWMRMLMPTDAIGILAMNLSDFFTLLVFVVIMYLLKKFIRYQNFGWIIIKLTIATIVATIIASVWNIFANFTFVFWMYGITDGSLNNWPMAVILFAFNSLKYSINFVGFMILYKPLKLAFNKYKSNL